MNVKLGVGDKGRI